MKKSFLSIVLLSLFACSSLFAQVSGGARVGANVSNLKYDGDGYSESDNSKIGLLLGLYLTYMLTDNVGIQPELFYSSMGAKDSDDSDYKTKLGYMALPILLRYNFNEQFSAFFGPQISFLLSAKYGDSDTEDIKEFLKGLDLGLVLGIGAEFGQINAGLRYLFGLSNIYDDSGDGYKIKSSAFQIVLGYRLFGE